MARKSRKSLVRLADKYFSLYIRKRDKFCVTCGSKDNLQCGHLFSRVSYTTRWDEDNAYCQCAGCNMRHEYDFEPLRRYAELKLGKEKYSELYNKFKTVGKVSNGDLEMIIEHYKSKSQEIG